MAYELNHAKIRELNEQIAEGGNAVPLTEYSDSELLMLIGGIWMLEQKGYCAKPTSMEDLKAETIRRTKRWCLEAALREGYLTEEEPR